MTTRSRMSVLAMLAALGSATTARAGLEIQFAGTVTSFSDTARTIDANGRIIDTPQLTDVGPGSTFAGTVLWNYDPASVQTVNRGYLPPPVTTFTIDNAYLFSSEMEFTNTGLHGPFGVEVLPPLAGLQDISFGAGHATLGVEIIAVLEAFTTTSMASNPIAGQADFLIGQDLTHFAGGTFSFGLGDYAATNFAEGQVGHSIGLEGTVTSLVVITPEPTTWMGAGVAGLGGTAIARRRRQRT